MSKSGWQQRERDAAAFFGAKRSVVNSTASRLDADGSDTDHEFLFIEIKNLASQYVWSLWDKTRAIAWKAAKKAKAFGRKPIVLMLSQNEKPGFMVCVHSDEFVAVVEEWLIILPEEVLAPLCQRVSQRRWAAREGEEQLEPFQS